MFGHKKKAKDPEDEIYKNDMICFIKEGLDTVPSYSREYLASFDGKVFTLAAVDDSQHISLDASRILKFECMIPWYYYETFKGVSYDKKEKKKASYGRYLVITYLDKQDEKNRLVLSGVALKTTLWFIQLHYKYKSPYQEADITL
jgi:hypothetical protein